MRRPLKPQHGSPDHFGALRQTTAAAEAAAHLAGRVAGHPEDAQGSAGNPPPATPAIPVDYAHTCMNHFVVLDLRKTGPIAAETLAALARVLCSSPLCDDLLVLQPVTNADVGLRIFGGDGLEADFCGNGLLYTASKIGDETGRDAVTIETPAGVRRASRLGDQWQAELGDAVRLDLDPELSGDLPVLGLMRAGEPHLVLDRPEALPGFNVDRARLEGFCRPLQGLTDIPGGINVTIVFQKQNDSVLIRTFERGVGRHTFSCGTGAIASIAAVYGTPDRARKFHVCSPGGMHSVTFDGEGWLLSARPVRIGSGVLVEGQLCLPLKQLQHYCAETAPNPAR